MRRELFRWFWNLWIGVDQFANACLGGDPDETVSSRLGRIKRAHHGKIPRCRPIARVTDFLLDKIDPGHSVNSIEDHRGAAGLVDRPPNSKSLWLKKENAQSNKTPPDES